MTNHKQEIENAVKQFRKTVDRINTSDHPQYRDPLVKEYEIKAARAELEANVAELSHQFDAAISQEVEAAEQKAKASRFFTTETQRKGVEFALDEYVAGLTLARDDTGKHIANNDLERRLEGMSAEELAYVRLQLPSVLSRVNGDPIALKKLQGLNEVLERLKTPEQERLDELKAAKASGADGAYRRLRMIHPNYNDFRDNIARMKN